MRKNNFGERKEPSQLTQNIGSAQQNFSLFHPQEALKRHQIHFITQFSNPEHS